MKLFFFFVFIYFNSGFSQELLPDSIATKSDRQKAVYLNQRAEDNKALDSMLLFTENALRYSEKCECDSLNLRTHYRKAYFQYHSGLYDDALAEISVLKKINHKIKNDVLAIEYLELESSILVYTGKQKEALKIGEEALSLAKKLNDSTVLAGSYENIGYLYNANEMVREAKKYYETALRWLEDTGASEKEKQNIYTNLRSTSDSYEEFLKYESLAQNAIEESDIANKAYLAVTASTILIDKNFDSIKAKELAKKGLILCDSINYLPLKKIALYNLGYLENKSENYKEAIPYFKESLLLLDRSNHQSLFLLLNGLSESYEKIGDLKSALQYKDSIITIKDSIFEASSTHNFAEFDAKFNLAEKDKAIAQQQLEIANQKNTRNKWIFGGVASLLLALGGFQWISFRQKRNKIAVETELKKEQEINDLRTKFLGNIAHEIRTPLTLISGNLDLALENLNQRDKAEVNIKTALENSKKVTEDANEILELLKFEKNKTTLKKVEVQLDESLKRIVYSFTSLIDMKGLSLNYNSNIPKDYTTQLDLEKVEKIINNLISNAIKYSPANKDINISSELFKNTLTLRVTDFGEGIHFDETEKIFERFYQSKNSKSIGGIGIGLSLSREFAELLDGTLTVKSKFKKGSTFTLSIPTPYIASSQLPFEETSQIPLEVSEEKSYKTKNPSTKKARILIVEDNPQMATYLKDILSKNYHCTLAFDGEEAFQKIKTEPFDLITSDIMMPKLDGFQLRSRLNEFEQYSNIPFILISAKTLEEDKIRGFKLGIDDYIVKPFNKNELLARITNLLSNKWSREQWELQNEVLISDTESSDKKLLKAIEDNVISNLSNENFKVKELAESVNYSQRQLTRIIKQHTGMTPVKFILEIRLQKAYQLLQHNSFFTLSEVRYDVGISSSPYFNKKFKERFGLNPSELLS